MAKMLKALHKMSQIHWCNLYEKLRAPMLSANDKTGFTSIIIVKELCLLIYFWAGTSDCLAIIYSEFTKHATAL